jgi:uncharacterized protein (PEP-CTERM system associated)
LRFIPTIGVSETWTDNYFLVGSDQPEEDQVVTRANAELLLLQQSERVRTRLKYDIDTVLNGPESGAIFQDGQLDFGTEVLRDWFFLDAVGSYGQYSVDPRVRRNPDHIFPSSQTLTDVASGNVTPSLRHNFGRVHFDASYSAGAVRFERRPDSTVGTQLQNSRYRNTNVGLSALGDPKLFWSASYEQQQVSYDNGLDVRHDRATLDLALKVLPPLKLLAHGGMESDPRVFNDEGGLDQSSWMGGFAWQYRLGELRLMAGEGVYGNTYDGSLTANGRLVKIDIGYHEQTTTQTEQFLPYLATDAQGNLITVGGNAVLSGVDDPFGRLNPDVFRQQRLRGRVALIGRLTEIELAFRSERRSYLISGANDRVHGMNVTISRTLGPRSRGEFNGRYDTVSVQGAPDFHDQAYALSFYRQIGQRMQIIATASHASLSSTSPYEANWIAVSFQMSFGRAAGGSGPPTPRTMGVPSTESR